MCPRAAIGMHIDPGPGLIGARRLGAPGVADVTPAVTKARRSARRGRSGSVAEPQLSVGRRALRSGSDTYSVPDRSVRTVGGAR